MCGIAGIISKQPINPQWIACMTNKIKHRGPDDEGYLFICNNKIIFAYGNDTPEEVIKSNYPYSPKIHINNVNTEDNYKMAFGHRRLSIIDLSPAGHQPMSYNNGNLLIVYNGEIYNYLEIRQELEKKGYEFKTNTDTEVILASYLEWGTDCLNKFNGMWAFVIYDKRNNILFGARDRFGVKPFYYFISDNVFAFASETKAFMDLPFYYKKINKSIAFQYLSSGITEENGNTFFEGIHELSPSFAFVFDISNFSLKKWQYYTLSYNDSWENFNEKKLSTYLIDIKDLIFKAVELRLRSDVSLGSCLSGGLDSSSIVCVINDILLKKLSLPQIGDKQKVFTAAYQNKNIDESNWAKIVVNKTNTQWFKTFPEADGLINDIQDLVYHQDFPFGSTSIYAQYRVMKLAKENHVKVLLDGQGGDELFTGYTGYYKAFFMEILKNMDIKRFFVELANLSNSSVNLKFVLVSLIKAFGADFLPDSGFYIHKKLTNKGLNFLNTDFWNENRNLILNLRDKNYKALNNMLFNLMIRDNLKELLRYEDRNSMRFSIESRTPFADDIDLIEYIFNISSSFKIYKGWSKYLLRESMKGILPEEIRKRKDKIGFATPEYFWLKEKSEFFKQFFNSLNEYIDTKNFLKNWDLIINSQNKIGITYLWRYINFAIWKEVYKL